MTMREFMALTKALADENRVRACSWPCAAASCASARSPSFSAWPPPPFPSTCPFSTRPAWSDSRKEGRWIYYSLPGKGASAAAREAIRWVAKSLANDPRSAEDAARLKKVLAMDPVELCKRQCRN